MRRLTMQVTIRVRSHIRGRGYDVAVGAGMPRHFATVAETRTYVGSLGADVRELDQWIKEGDDDSAKA